jgi:cell division protein FtsB
LISKKQAVLFSLALCLALSLLFFIIFSTRGLADLNQMKKERDRIRVQNQQITQENLTLGVEIDRLHNDPAYIESIARKDLGMIGQNEIVVKPQRTPER